MMARIACALAQSLADVPHSLNPRFVTARAREDSVCRTACFLLGLCCWVAVPFAGLLVFRAHAWIDSLNPQLVLNETLATIPDFEVTIKRGAATRLPPDGFSAVLPSAVFHLLVEQLDPLDVYARAALQKALLWWQSRYEPQHAVSGTWWRDTQSFGVPVPDEFQLGELVKVRKTRMPWHAAGVASLWPTVGSERVKESERLAKIVGVHPSRTLSDFSYTIVYCDGDNELAMRDLQPSGGFRRRPAVNCTATVDTSLIDPKTRRGRELRYGLSVHGRHLPSVRATFGAQHTWISSAEAVLAQPSDAAGNLTNARALFGRVAVVRRGGCEFVDKAARVQQAGAIALVIVNYEDVDVKAGSVEGGAADYITIPVVTVRRTVGAPLLAHAAQAADAFEQQHRGYPSRPNWRQKKLRGVEVDLAFGAARHTATATPSPRSAKDEEFLNEEQPLREYWERVEASWRQEGGWRGDPGLRGRQVVVSSSRLKRAGTAGRTVGVVNGNTSVMEWEDNWPALAARAEMLLTRQQIVTFAGYSHHYGGFWRFEDDKTDRAVSYPYTEAGLQAVAPLWLASALFCEALPIDPAAVPSVPAGSSGDSAHMSDGSSSGDFDFGEEYNNDEHNSHPLDMQLPGMIPGMISYDSSPYLNLNCSNTIAARRASAVLQGLQSGGFGAVASLKGHYVLIDVFLVAVTCMDSLIRLLPMWSIVYVPACYVACNVMRHVDSPSYTIREAILIAAYAYTPIALLDGLSHGLSRALGSSPPMVLFGGETPPEWLTHFAINLVRAFWTPLGAFSLWGAFLAHWQRTARAEGIDDEVEIQARAQSNSTQQSGEALCGTDNTPGDLVDASDGDANTHPMCRICMDGVEEENNLGPLISPCLCRGSMSYVHSGCLNRWRMRSANPISATHCDNCRFQYRLITTWRASTVLRSVLMLLVASAAVVVLMVISTAHLVQAVIGRANHWLGDKLSSLTTGYSLTGPNGFALEGSLSVQQVAAFFDMDWYTLRVIDDKWGFSALLRMLHLDGMYIMGALVLIGGFGWISIGMFGPIFWSSGLQRGLSLGLIVLMGIARVWWRLFERLRERSADLLGVEQEPTVKDFGGPVEVASLIRAREAAVASACSSAPSDTVGSAQARAGTSSAPSAVAAATHIPPDR